MKVACNNVGGPAECPSIAEGSSPEELAEIMTQHGMSHDAIKGQMAKMTEMEKAEWMALMKSKIEH